METKPRGRPKGAKNNVAVLKLRRFVSIREIEQFVKIAKKKAEEDPQLLKFILEQIFGKAPQYMQVEPVKNNISEMENQLRSLNANNEPKLIEGEVIGDVSDQEAGASALQDGQGDTLVANPDSGSDIRPDMETPASSECSDVPYEIREILRDSSGGADQGSDLPREVGDSGSLGEESEDNNELPD